MAVVITQTADPAGVAGVATVVTYTAVATGPASADRIVVVEAGGEAGTAMNPVSATIDSGSGDSATTALASAALNKVASRIFYLPVPTGTAADIKVTWTGTPGSTENHIAVYSVTGASSTINGSGVNTSTDMDATAPLTTGSITIPANGGFLAVAVGETDTVAKTWANATEDLDEDAGTHRFTTAISTTGGTVTVTCTGGTNGEDGALAWIIFDPSVADTLFAQSVM